MELQIIKHKDILFRDILRAISIKTISWPHPIESQVKWIIDNMQSDDRHVFLTENEEDEAYMTLTPAVGIMNGSMSSFMGVGCVCTSSRGKGFGGMLLLKMNQFLIDNNYKGLLFCKSNLIPFYEKFGWIVVPNDIIVSPYNDSVVYTMVFNCPVIESFEYNDRLF